MLKWCICAVVTVICIQLVTGAEKFSCNGRASGYYADVETGCQIYHMCDGLGRQFSYHCPNTTLFQQRMLICDHWYMVNCSKSEHDYSANLLIGQRDKPFVEDSQEHPYHRTPRPDLRNEPYAPRYSNKEFRGSRAQSISKKNLVGVATDNEDGTRNSNTDRPQYFLPSHWSTEYGKAYTTPLPVKKVQKPLIPFGKPPVGTGAKSNSFDSKYYKVTKAAVQISTKQNIAGGDSENAASVSPSTLALPPFAPNEATLNENSSRINATPLDSRSSEANSKVPRPDFSPNTTSAFASKPTGSTNFETSRPAFVTNSRSPIEQQSGVSTTPFKVPSQEKTKEEVVARPISQPTFERKVFEDSTPSRTEEKINLPETPSIYYQPPKFSASFDAESTTMDPQTFYKLVPSKDLQPPVLKKYTNNLTVNSIVTSTTTTTQKTVSKKEIETERPTDKIMTDRRWKELRQMFFIPEYDFPLEAGPRPSYEGGLSSFQVNSAPDSPEMRFREANGSGPNSDCPKCDPKFLVPGTCKPCVMIRR